MGERDYLATAERSASTLASGTLNAQQTVATLGVIKTFALMSIAESLAQLVKSNAISL